jgi:hypothetical protein
MASTTSLSTDIAVGILPEYDSKKDPPLYNELARLRAAIRNLAAALDQYTGASAVNQSQFSNGYIPFGSSTGLTANSTLSYDNSTHTLSTASVTLTDTLSTGTFKSTTTALGFYSIAASPITQPTTAFAPATFVAGAGTAVNDASTFDGYTLKQVVKALRSLGILA